MKLFSLALIFVFSLASCATPTKQESGELIGTNWVMPLQYGYKFSFKDGIHTIYKSESNGPIQLSSYKKEGLISEAELKKIALSQVGQRGELEKVSRENVIGFKSIFKSEGVYWIYWFYAIENTLIFVTYNTEIPRVNSDEVEVVETLVNGISAT